LSSINFHNIFFYLYILFFIGSFFSTTLCYHIPIYDDGDNVFYDKKYWYAKINNKSVCIDVTTGNIIDE
jgi:hypothetical protein